MSNKPFLLYTYANAQTEERFLPEVPREYHAVLEILRQVKAEGLCDFDHYNNLSYPTLLDLLQNQHNRNFLTIFHFSGHGGLLSLELAPEESSERADKVHLTDILAAFKRLNSLKLVFLNACYSHSLAKSLVTEGGVVLVIGAPGSIDDEAAKTIAIQFYKGLANGLTIRGAWEDCKAFISQNHRNNARDTGDVYSDDTDPSNYLQLMEGQGGRAALEWSLPSAANQPLFGIPDLPNDIPWPPNPFHRFLGRYQANDARVFFGRGVDIHRLYHGLSNVNLPKVVLLYGQTGVGKSSLLEAGLIPRLNREYEVSQVIRRSNKGVSADLCQFFSLPLDASPKELCEKWLEKEAMTKKPLIILLDQLEEAYTQQGNHLGKEEIQKLAQTLRNAFVGDDIPKGKILLSYRKEFHPEILAELQPHVRTIDVHLEPLKASNIEEVLWGLASTPELVAMYKVQIEKELPGTISSFLATDQESSIAPVLQIILSKLWDEEKDEVRIFSVQKFQNLVRKGVLLPEFFEAQLNKLKEWAAQLNNDTYDSGLALDILHYHTSDHQSTQGLDYTFSRNCSLEDIREQYNHRTDVLEQLLQQLKAVYLITSSSTKDLSLIHDTFAPIVIKKFQESPLPGQRAYRILTSKLPEYLHNEEKITLDEDELSIVESGISGMRFLVPKAKELIEQSRIRKAQLETERAEALEKTKKIQKLRRGILLVVGFLLLFSVVALQLWWANQRKIAINALLVSQVRSVAIDEPVVALKGLKQALALDSKSELVLQARHDLIAENEFYHFKKKFGQELRAFALDPTRKYIAVLGTDSLWIMSSDPLSPHGKGFKLPARGSALSFTSDNQHLIIGLDDSTLYKFNLKNLSLSKLHSFYSPIAGMAYHSAKSRLVILLDDGSLKVCSNNDFSKLQTLEFHIQENLELTKFAPQGNIDFSPTGDTLAICNFNKNVDLIHWEKGFLKNFAAHTDLVLSVQFSDAGNEMLTTGRDNTIYRWDLKRALPKMAFNSHEQRVNYSAFGSGQDIISASEDRTIRVWNKYTRISKKYKGHTAGVWQVEWLQPGDTFLSVGHDSSMIWWRMDSKVAATYGVIKPGISAFGISKDQRYLIAGGCHKYLVQFSNMNDPDEDEEIFPSGPKTLFLWDMLKPNSPKKIATSSYGFHAVLTLENATTLVSDLNKVLIFDAQGRQQRLPIAFDDLSIVKLTELPNGQIVVVGETKIYFIDASLNVIDSIPNPFNGNGMNPGTVTSLAHTHQTFLIGGRTGTGMNSIYKWEKNKFVPLWNKQKSISAMALSDDGSLLAVADDLSNTVTLYHLPDLRVVTMLVWPVQKRDGLDRANDIQFFKDKKNLAIGTRGGQLLVYDLISYARRWTFSDGMGFDIMDIEIGADQKSIFASYNDGKIRFYKLDFFN